MMPSRHIGYPRPLFDSNFIPPVLLHRTKELKSIGTLFQSSLNPDDFYTCNVYISGMDGVGKTVFALYFLKLLKNKNPKYFTDIYLNLSLKSPAENLRLLVEEYAQSLAQNFKYMTTSRKLWSYFHFLRKKTDIPLLLVLDNVNEVNRPLYEKFIKYSRDLKISIIAASPRSYTDYRTNSKLLAEKFDFPLHLDLYSSSALLDILLQRVSLTFPFNLNANLTKYIVDIVTQFDYYRPSTCINFLKALYQHLICGRDVSAPLIRDASLDLVEFPFQGDLKCLLDFDDEPVDIFYLPLLEKLAIYFQRHPANVYITYKELYQLYKIGCDELDLPYQQTQFRKFLDKLLLDGFLYTSQFKSGDEKSFYMIIDPDILLEYLEIKF